MELSNIYEWCHGIVLTFLLTISCLLGGTVLATSLQYATFIKSGGYNIF